MSTEKVAPAPVSVGATLSTLPHPTPAPASVPNPVIPIPTVPPVTVPVKSP
jgi:hypothetical protein